MNKRSALLATLLMASVMIGMMPVYAETAEPNDTLVVIAITGAFIGAISSTVIGWWNAPDTEKYSGKKLAGTLLLTAISVPMQTGIASILSGLPDSTTLYVLFLVFGQALAVGFGLDLAHSKLKN